MASVSCAQFWQYITSRPADPLPLKLTVVAYHLSFLLTINLKIQVLLVLLIDTIHEFLILEACSSRSGCPSYCGYLTIFQCMST
jgi:hypothetical protein